MAKKKQAASKTTPSRGGRTKRRPAPVPRQDAAETPARAKRKPVAVRASRKSAALRDEDPLAELSVPAAGMEQPKGRKHKKAKQTAAEMPSPEAQEAPVRVKKAAKREVKKAQAEEPAREAEKKKARQKYRKDEAKPVETEKKGRKENDRPALIPSPSPAKKEGNREAKDEKRSAKAKKEGPSPLAPLPQGEKGTGKNKRDREGKALKLNIEAGPTVLGASFSQAGLTVVKDLPEPPAELVAGEPDAASLHAGDSGRAQFFRKKSKHDPDAGRRKLYRRKSEHAADGGRNKLYRRKSEHEPGAGRGRLQRKSKSVGDAMSLDERIDGALLPVSEEPQAKPKGKPARPAKPAHAVALLEPQEEILKKARPSSTASSKAPPAPPEPQAWHGPEPTPTGAIDRGAPIPERYGLDRLVALVRDPQWVFGYWELTGGLTERLAAERGGHIFDQCAWVLRVYRIGENVMVDTEVDPGTGNWYIHVGKPGRYQLELGLLTPDGEWISLLASNEVETPAEGISDLIDDEWRLRPEDEERLRLLLLKELGLDEEGLRRRATSGYLGASGLVSSWRLVGSWLGASWGGSFSGRPVAGSWAWSFVGASGRPTSGGSGGFGHVGWIVGPDGRHEAQLDRPSRDGGPNWNEQRNLPQRVQGRTAAPHFKVKLPRSVKVASGVRRPQPTWGAVTRRGVSTRRKK